MGLFEDFSRFLETRLEEFLRNNPHLELQALEEQLRQQEEDTLQLMADLQRNEKQLETEILETAKEVQRWHGRIEKAKAANRLDLAEPAEAREAALLRQGNQLWGQMQGVKDRIQKTKELYHKIQDRRREVRVKVAQAEAERVAARAAAREVASAAASAKASSTSSAEQAWQSTNWNQSVSGATMSTDELEASFQRWEMDEELEDMKRNMGK